MENIGEIGEHEAIRRLTATLGDHPLLRTGAGDDCAVVEVPGAAFDQVFTTDPLIEGIHFISGEVPERIGHKAVGRVLSDLAAMGAQPQWILVNVVASPEQEMQTLERIYAGMNRLCQHFGATIIGGDLAQGTCLELHVFGMGTVPIGQALLRSGANPGDFVFVTGPLGCSIEGKHLDFIPRVAEGLFLREADGVTSMMDLSDGLATDLRHILRQSGVGAQLNTEQIPRNGSLDQALHDGEDFELIFTVSPENSEMLKRRWEEKFGSEIFNMGCITERVEEFMLLYPDGAIQRLDKKAFEHFKAD